MAEEEDFTVPGAETLDNSTRRALEEWVRLRQTPSAANEERNALQEWLRVRGKKGIFSPAKDYPIGKFNNLENIRLRWLVPRIFDFVPRSENPFSFTRYNGQIITPRRMFTDGGSIPRLARWIAQLDPWQYTPAYLLHDWIFELHHCNVANKSPDIYTFNDANKILMEAIHTMDYYKIAPVSDFVFHVIKFAVSSFVARSFWDVDVKTCTLPPDTKD